MTINERIRLILDRKGISNKTVAEWLSMTNSRLSQKFKEGIWDSVAELQVIAEKTGFALDWIITGKDEDAGMHIQASEGEGKTVPFFDAVVTAGMALTQEVQEPHIQSYERVNTGTLFRDATAAMRVYGDSMFPKYQAGCMIALKEVFDKDQIVYGEDYVVESSEQRILKRLLRSEKGEEYIELNSINPQVDSRGRQIYGPKDMHLGKIRRIYKVLGQVRYEMGGDAIIHN
jgi:SOS-response transcriptional repressor LexA